MRNQVDAFSPVIGVVQIERRWHDLIADGQDAENALNRACAAKKVAYGRLGRAHRYMRHRIAKQALYRAQFNRIGHGRCAMGVDIIDIGWRHARLFQRHLHRPKSPVSFRMRCRYVIGVARQAVAYDFSINLCTTRLCMFIFFQNDDACAFPHNKTVAVLVIRPTGGFWTVVIAHV